MVELKSCKDFFARLSRTLVRQLCRVVTKAFQDVVIACASEALALSDRTSSIGGVQLKSESPSEIANAWW